MSQKGLRQTDGQFIVLIDSRRGRRCQVYKVVVYCFDKPENRTDPIIEGDCAAL